jgi:nitroreductase
MDKAPADDTARRARIGDEATRQFMANPTVVAVAVALEGDELRRREDYAATCCAIQNVQLAAWAEGVGVKWSTSGVIRDPLAYELLGLDPARCELIALLYVGYPAEVPVRERKLPLELVVRWTE